jgi:hypothetical protein
MQNQNVELSQRRTKCGGFRGCSERGVPKEGSGVRKSSLKKLEVGSGPPFQIFIYRVDGCTDPTVGGLMVTLFGSLTV